MKKISAAFIQLLFNSQKITEGKPSLSIMSRAQIEKQNKCKNVINRNHEHNHRANKENGYIYMITDKKQYDRIQIKWKKVLKT